MMDGSGRPEWTPGSHGVSLSAGTMVKVSVVPVTGGWSVVHDLDPTPLMFLAGAKAEAQALRIVRLAGLLGHAVELQIITRDGQPASARGFAEVPALPKLGRVS